MTYSNFVTMAAMSAVGMAVLLEFINKYVLIVLLPAGIVLRCFTLTRKVGATLMALAVGLYVFYPMALAWDGMIYGSGTSAGVVPTPSRGTNSLMSVLNAVLDPTPWLEVFGGPPFRRFCVHWWDWVWCWWAAIIWWIIMMAVAFVQINIVLWMLYYIAYTYLPFGGIGAVGYDYLVTLIPWMVKPMVAAFLFPLIDLIIVVTAIRAISPAIGGETRISGLVEFI